MHIFTALFYDLLHLCKEYLTAVKLETLFLLQIKYRQYRFTALVQRISNCGKVGTLFLLQIKYITF